MSENTVASKLGPLHWLHGLEDYFEFVNDTESKKLVTFLLKLVYSDKPVLTINDTVDTINFVEILKQFSPSPTLNIIHKYLRSEFDPVMLQDAFSRGQVQSKIWLATELARLNIDFDMIYVLAGWFGQLAKYLDQKNINYNKLRSFDIDPVACEVSDKVFNLDSIEDYRVKSVELDVTATDWIYRTGCSYPIKNYSGDGKTITEKTTPSLIINTSAEHFSEDWYYKFSLRLEATRPLFVIQTNNFFDVDEHINCVHTLDEMKQKFLMSEILYQGELDLGKYKRFMLIGRR